MRKRIRIFSFMVLCFYLTGCTAYHTVEVPGAEKPLGYYESLDIERGDRVRVALVDGTKLEGVVVSSDRESLTIDELVRTNGRTITGERRVLPLVEIADLSRLRPNTAGTVALVAVGLVVVAWAIVGSMAPDFD